MGNSARNVWSGSASAAATVDIQANSNASSGDDWRLSSATSQGGLNIQNNTSGSQVTKMSISTAGNVSIAGTLGVTGTVTLSSGIATGANTKTRWATWNPTAAANATDVAYSTSTVYLSQIWVPHNETITGVGVLNGTHAGSNSIIVALFDSAGNALANSNLAGTSTSGASAFQQVALTATYAAKGPATYWVGLYGNGTTDKLYAIPSIGQSGGLAGSVTGQTFGTVANLSSPTTFTADKGPVSYVY